MLYRKCPQIHCQSDVDWKNTNICPLCGYNILTPIISNKKFFVEHRNKHSQQERGRINNGIYLPEINPAEIFKETISNGSLDGIAIEYTFKDPIADYGLYSSEKNYTNRIYCLDNPGKIHQYPISTDRLNGYQKRICQECGFVIRGEAPLKCPECGQHPWKEQIIEEEKNEKK